MTGLKTQIPQGKMNNAGFWSERYKTGNTGWDIGEISRPLKEYIDQLENKDLHILIPGAGNAWEAEYLFKKDFSGIFIADIAREPLENFANRVPLFPKDHLLHTDFFNIEKEFDLILEQTFFCALPVDKRPDYAKQAHKILKPGGKVVGVLFDFPLTETGPPFGGNKEEYLMYFSRYFSIEILEPCYNSIKPRMGNELFFKFQKL